MSFKEGFLMFLASKSTIKYFMQKMHIQV